MMNDVVKSVVRQNTTRVRETLGNKNTVVAPDLKPERDRILELQQEIRKSSLDPDPNSALTKDIHAWVESCEFREAQATRQAEASAKNRLSVTTQVRDIRRIGITWQKTFETTYDFIHERDVDAYVKATIEKYSDEQTISPKRIAEITVEDIVINPPYTRHTPTQEKSPEKAENGARVFSYQFSYTAWTCP